MKKLIPILALVAVLTFCTIAFADNSKSENQMTTIDNFSIIIGHWVGEGFGGVCEEAWRAPSANTMVGTFKLIKDDKLRMFEVQLISQNTYGWELGVKHFGPDMSGWEDKADHQSFRFISASANELRFEGLIYQRVGSDSLYITLDVESEEESEQMVLKMTRKPE